MTVAKVELIQDRGAPNGQRLASRKAAGVLGGLAIGPGAAAALLAKAACPFCYPAIAALFSSLGLGFLFRGAYFAILAILLLGLVLFGLAFQASRRRGYGPFCLGLVSSAVVLAAKLIWDLDAIMYTGISGLVAASIWNLLPIKNLTSGSCSACVTTGAHSTDAQGESNMTTTKRKIEIFSAGCAVCEDAIQLVKKIACESCEVTVLDMSDKLVAERAKKLGIRSVPAVLVNGQPADCCSGSGPDEKTLRAAGVGSP